jgi:hypothetical protein
MRRIFRIIANALAFAACVWLCSCSKTPTTAAATSETTNGLLRGKALNPDLTPATGATVYLVDADRWLENLVTGKTLALDSAIADDSGTFVLTVPRTGSCNVQIDNGTEGLFIRNIASQLDSGVTAREFTLTPCAAFSGTIVPESGVASELALGGSMYTTAVNAGSGFSMSALAEGTFGVVAKINTSARDWSLCTAVRLDAGSVISAGDITAPLAGLVVDDFSGNAGQTNLGRVIGSGWWYTVTDNIQGGTSTLALSNDPGAGAFAGQSRHATYVIGAGSGGPYAIMGFYIGKKDSTYAAATAALSALSFMIRGTGTITVSFVNILTDPAENKRSVSFDHMAAVPSQWSRMEIPVDSLRVTADNRSAMLGKSWGQFNHSLQIITFMASGQETAIGDTVDVWLDDITFKGVSLANFVP